jgi:hypothetical protein
LNRRALAAVVLLLLLPASRAAASEPIACAVRLREGVVASAGLAPEAVRSQPVLAPTRHQVRKASGHPLERWVVLTFADATACAAAHAQLARDARVEICELVRTFRVCATDVRAAAGEIPSNVQQVRAPEALQRVVPDTTLVVAVIDTGADLTHPDLIRRLWRNDDPIGNGHAGDDAVDQNGDGRVEAWERDDDDDNGYVDDLYGYDFTDAPGKGGSGDALLPDNDPSDEHGHGTHVAGILAADGSLQGVAPFVRLMPVRAAYTTAFGGGVLETDDAAAAIVYAVDNGARILNLSWGDREDSQLVREALAFAASRDVVIVAAAGNGATNAPHYPSADPHVLAVGAVDGAGARASFSNYGPGVTLAAPGERFAGLGGGIVSLDLDGGRAERRGTSMAAPHVAGIAAILLSRSDRPNAAAVRAALIAGARGDRPWSPEIGHGIADALAALEARSPLFLTVDGPQHAFRRGHLTLIGTIVGGDLLRWRLDIRRLAASATTPLVEWRQQAVANDTLVHAALGTDFEGECEYVLTAETGAGEVAERHGPFRVDVTAPRLDTLTMEVAWRGAEPRLFSTALSDDAVAMTVATANDTVRAGDSGYARRNELEVAAAAWTSLPVTVRCVNAADLARDTTVAPLVARAPWPRGGRAAVQSEIDGFFADPIAGTARDGAAVVWGRAGMRSSAVIQGWVDGAGGPRLWYHTGFDGIPIGYADVSGDGAADLVVRRGRDSIEWWGAPAKSPFPDSLLGTATAERALGVFQLDDDPPFETLLSSRDSLFLFDDAASGAPRRMQSWRNPSRSSFATWGADAAAGDLDGDGAIDIVSGDAGGFIVVFERDAGGRFQLAWSGDSGGVYAYDFTALPEGGFLVGRQRSADPAGDGFATAVFEFIRYAPSAAGYVVEEALPFLAPSNDLGAGSAAVSSPASGAAWLALVRGEDLYLLRGLGAARTQEAVLGGVARRAPAWLDWNRDGKLDLVVRTASGTTVWRLDEGEIGPHDLTSTSLGDGRLRLDWVPATGTTSRIRRAAAGDWRDIGVTTESSAIDSVASGEWLEYEIVAEAAGVPRGVSNRIRARAQARPRLLEAARAGARSIRVSLSQPVHPNVGPSDWRGRDAAGRAWPVQQLTRAADGREVTLVFEGEPACGTFTLVAAAVRDEQNGLLDPPVDSTTVAIPCTTPAFVVESVGFVGREVEVAFSRPPGFLAFEPSRYRLRWQSRDLPLVAVRAVSATRLRLEPDAAVRFEGLGIPYFLRLDAAIRSAADTPLEYSEIEHVLRVDGRGATHVVAWPNPAGPNDAAIVFADAGAGTQITLYDLEGERVRTLEGAVGGGIRWDLRHDNGGIVPSGVYFFVARDATGSRQGRVVVRR